LFILIVLIDNKLFFVTFFLLQQNQMMTSTTSGWYFTIELYPFHCLHHEMNLTNLGTKGKKLNMIILKQLIGVKFSFPTITDTKIMGNCI